MSAACVADYPLLKFYSFRARDGAPHAAEGLAPRQHLVDASISDHVVASLPAG